MATSNSNPPPDPPPSDSRNTPTPASEEPPPIPLQDHELLRPIGKGSYGTVWLARNIMGVYRAVKIVYRKSFPDSRPFERELSGIKKFEPISRSHEGFVDVLHVGITPSQDCFYYVMELGDAQNGGQDFDPATYSPKTLQKEISIRSKLSFEECLQLGIALSDALGALHKHGLAHRDVKPSNIIFVNGVPKLADIGLVAGFDETVSYVGTQGFIPPEGPGTSQADIYSLGKVLYEASTGKDRLDFPDLPTQLDVFDDQEKFLELNEVILQACRNDRAKRYQFAWDMHSDLLIIANGKSVKRLRLLEKRFSNVKRALTVSLLGLALAAAIVYPLVRERRAAAAARQQQVGEDLAYGNRAVESGDTLDALPYFADALRLDQGNADRETSHRLRFGSTLAQCPKLLRVFSIGGNMSDSRISPDNQRILLCQSTGIAQLFDLNTGQPRSRRVTNQLALAGGDFSADGRWIAMASEQSPACVSLWNAADLTPVRSFSLPTNGMFSAKFSPDGRWVVASCVDNLIRVWPVNSSNNNSAFVLTGHTATPRFATFSHDGTCIISGGQDNTARLWDARTHQQIGKPFKHANWVYGGAFSPDDRRIATACFDYAARIWDRATGEQVLTDLKHDGSVQSVEFSPDGRLILTGSLDGTARLWCADNGQSLGANLIMRHPSGVMHASFSSDGKYVTTACFDGTACVWDISACAVPPLAVKASFSADGSRFLTVTNETVKIFYATNGLEVSHFTAPGLQFKSAGLNPSGRFFLGLFADKTNFQWQVRDASSGFPIGVAIRVPDAGSRASLSDDGKRLATCSTNIAQAWDLLTGKPLFPPVHHTGRVNHIFFSPGGNLLATGCGISLHIWNATNGVATFPPLEHFRPVSYAAFSPDGKYIVTCCADQNLTSCFAQVWSAETGAPIGPKLWHGDGVVFAAFSPDGQRLVTAGEDHNALIWDFRAGKRLPNAMKHSNTVLSAVFSPDGKWIVTVTADDNGRVQVWDAATAEPLTPALYHPGSLKQAVFLPGGRRIAAMDARGNAWIWDLPVDPRPVENLRQLAGLLSSDFSQPSGNYSGLKSETPQSRWQRLKNLYPETFATSPQHEEAWREFQAQLDEADGQWFAAAFHLARLVALHPGDPLLGRRLATATNHLIEPRPDGGLHVLR